MLKNLIISLHLMYLIFLLIMQFLYVILYLMKVNLKNLDLILK